MIEKLFPRLSYNQCIIKNKAQSSAFCGKIKFAIRLLNKVFLSFFNRKDSNTSVVSI